MTLEELKQFSRRSEALRMKDFRETLQRFGMDDEYIMEKCSEFLRNPIFFICSRTDEDLARALLSLVMYGVEEAGEEFFYIQKSSQVYHPPGEPDETRCGCPTMEVRVGCGGRSTSGIVWEKVYGIPAGRRLCVTCHRIQVANRV